MSLSIFDLFKIGVGPSSSHTVGPMLAALRFAQGLHERGQLARVQRVEVLLFGSLSATGVGHATDRAVLAGLLGEHPARLDPDAARQRVDAVLAGQPLRLAGTRPVAFVCERDLHWHAHSLPYHPNAMSLVAHLADGLEHRETWYSVGGGFILEAAELDNPQGTPNGVTLPFPFDSARQLLAHCRQHGMRVSDLMLENETTWRTQDQVQTEILQIWRAMQQCVARGLTQDGVLPGGLNVPRRARALHACLREASDSNVISSTLSAMEWVNLFALAVNEENAAGGRVVTAPTNGAAGIIPAVLHYVVKFRPQTTDNEVMRFFLAAGAVGILCKTNASISGAEVGCQGEVGSACAMAAAGLAELLGASPEQVENAAEIGLEHNLGLTCDPVAGLVQVPCIERNAIAAVKAVNAAQMALRGNGTHLISLDQAIRTLRDTGADMHEKYKETSLGGLAVSWVAC